MGGNRRSRFRRAPGKKVSGERSDVEGFEEGHAHKEIAGLLDISAKTVIAHYTNAQEKLDIHNRAELIKFALRRGIIKQGGKVTLLPAARP
jgi:DNA-binding NarL/FixJ family response regulator